MGVAWGWKEALTDPLEGERAFPEHGEGGVHQLALELPEGPVAGEGDILAPSRQQIRGYLRDRQSQSHPRAAPLRMDDHLTPPQKWSGELEVNAGRQSRGHELCFLPAKERRGFGTDEEVLGQMRMLGALGCPGYLRGAGSLVVCEPTSPCPGMQLQGKQGPLDGG